MCDFKSDVMQSSASGCRTEGFSGILVVYRKLRYTLCDILNADVLRGQWVLMGYRQMLEYSPLGAFSLDISDLATVGYGSLHLQSYQYICVQISSVLDQKRVWSC